MERRATWWETLTCGGQGLTARDKRNQWIAVAWIFVWSLSCVLASAVLVRDLVPAGVMSWVVALLPTLLGIGTVLAFRRFLVEADELQRKIQLDGLAVGFGLGVIGSFGLRLVERAGGPAFDVDDAIVLMMVGYAVAVVVGSRRYA